MQQKVTVCVSKQGFDFLNFRKQPFICGFFFLCYALFTLKRPSDHFKAFFYINTICCGTDFFSKVIASALIYNLITPVNHIHNILDKYLCVFCPQCKYFNNRLCGTPNPADGAVYIRCVYVEKGVRYS